MRCRRADRWTCPWRQGLFSSVVPAALPAIQIKKPPSGRLLHLSGEERGIVGCIPAPDPDARCAPGPACGCPVLLLQNRRTPAGLLTTHPIRQTNAKGPPCGRPFCVCLAERGGSDRPDPNPLTLQQIANRTCVLCCVRSIIASKRGGKQSESALALSPSVGRGRAAPRDSEPPSVQMLQSVPLSGP